jgi:hypothetical protein
VRAGRGRSGERARAERRESRTGLLVVDEIGYLSYDNRNADLLFQVVSRRNEKRSIVLTTNLTFGEWPIIFPNAACITALIDRLVHLRDHQHRGQELPSQGSRGEEAARAEAEGLIAGLFRFPRILVSANSSGYLSRPRVSRRALARFLRLSDPGPL